MNFRKTMCTVLAAAALGASAADAPRYIFYFIGDGMGISPVMAAQAYNRDVHHADTLLTMLRMPVVGWCMSYSASAPITDSAAAGTALSTGHKTRNNMLGMGPDTTSVTSVARQFKDNGFGVGIVTSVAADDATPGSFYAHVPGRKMYADIDLQAAECGYDFMAGASLSGLSTADSTRIREAMAANNVDFYYGPDGAMQAAESESQRVFLVNNPGSPSWNIGYTIDSIAGTLTLPQITRSCLEYLERKSPDGFFMMVEGGNIDHALHGNDGGAALKEILNFDSAVAIAYSFYQKHPDETLIVVTADHDTGGMSHVHSRTGQHNPLRVIDFQKVSKEVFSSWCKSLIADDKEFTWDDMRHYLEENLGLFGPIKVSDERAAKLREMYEHTFNLRDSADQKTLYASFNAFAVEVFKLVNDAAGLAFTTVGHSGNPTPVFAAGVGAERFGSLNNNSELPRIIRSLCGFPQL